MGKEGWGWGGMWDVLISASERKRGREGEGVVCVIEYNSISGCFFGSQGFRRECEQCGDM